MMVLSPSSPSSNPQHTTSCRVISAEAKTNNRHEDNPRIAGYLEVCGELRWAAVKDGSLIVSGGRGTSSRPIWRLPLRGLNLQPSSPIGLAFSLTTQRENHTLASFKVKNEDEYERWVKVVAAELMRQTPLDSVRFLDILGITGSLRRSRSADSLSATTSGLIGEGGRPRPPPDIQLSVALGRPPPPRLPPCLRYRKRTDLPDVIRDLPPSTTRKSRSRRREWGCKERGQSLEGLIGAEDLEDEERSRNLPPRELIERCRRSDVYVPVKEKRLLFESLLSGGGEVRRAQSLLDLAVTAPPHPVRDMARLFERRSTAPDTSIDKHFLHVSEDMRYLRNDEGSRGRKQFSLPEVKIRHHSNIR